MKLAAADLRHMLRLRRGTEFVFKFVAVAALLIALGSLATLLIDAFLDGAGRLSWQFLTSFPSRRPEEAGILSSLVGTVYLILLTALVAFPVGVGAAIYLEEYAASRWYSRLIEVNIANLAGVPSIIYGLLGLELFVRALGLERSLLAGALTMALLVLPIIIISSREAMRTVPPSIREASCALGASRWQTIWHQVLPLALPGILTGSILAFSRAIGEAAPLITIGALTYIAFLPDGLLAPFTALPIQIFNWVSRPQKGFHANAAGAILVLLVVLLLMNALAVFLRHRHQQRLRL
ncbi:MAG: phosphate ABC transporter permease PstA [Nitrospirae bacterium]|nr:phosphate ABC transporter permease PstA [Nitrospirota bacterium]